MHFLIIKITPLIGVTLPIFRQRALYKLEAMAIQKEVQMPLDESEGIPFNSFFE